MKVEQRKSWGQAKHSLEDSGELYMSTQFLGVDQLARSAHNLELHFYYRWQVEQKKGWGQAKHSLEDSGELYRGTHFLGLDQLDRGAHNLELNFYCRVQVEQRKGRGRAGGMQSTPGSGELPWCWKPSRGVSSKSLRSRRRPAEGRRRLRKMAPQRSRRAVCLPALPWDASLSNTWGTYREGRRTAGPGLYLEGNLHWGNSDDYVSNSIW